MKRQPSAKKGTLYMVDKKALGELIQKGPETFKVGDYTSLLLAYQNKKVCTVGDAIGHVLSKSDSVSKSTLERRHRELKKKGIVVEVRPIPANNDTSQAKHSHSKEIADQVLLSRSSELLIPKDCLVWSNDLLSDMVGYTKEHLQAYPDIVKAEENWHESETDVKERTKQRDDTLTEKVLTVTRKIYPRMPGVRQGDQGPTPIPCVYIDTISNIMAREIDSRIRGYNSYVLTKERVMEDLHGGGKWRVSERGVQTFALVETEADCHTEELTNALEGLLSDTELRRLFEGVSLATKKLGESKRDFELKCRKLGTQLKDGVRLEGNCSLGY